MTIFFATYGGLGGGNESAEVSVYDIRGRLVRTLVRGEYPAGEQSTTWDGRNEQGRPVGAGVYFLRAVTGGSAATKKVTVLR